MPTRYFEKSRTDPELALIDQLVEIRKQRGLKAHHVARRMGCSRAGVSMLETSARRGHSITIERLLRYANAIGAEIHVAVQPPPPEFNQ